MLASCIKKKVRALTFHGLFGAFDIPSGPCRIEEKLLYFPSLLLCCSSSRHAAREKSSSSIDWLVVVKTCRCSSSSRVPTVQLLVAVLSNPRIYTFRNGACFWTEEYILLCPDWGSFTCRFSLNASFLWLLSLSALYLVVNLLYAYPKVKYKRRFVFPPLLEIFLMVVSYMQIVLHFLWYFWFYFAWFKDIVSTFPPNCTFFEPSKPPCARLG